MNTEIITDMSNTQVEHSIIVSNFVHSVDKVLRSSTCRVFGEGMQFQWDLNGKIYVPDAFIICSFKRRSNTTIHEVPRMVMEVLSPSTEKYDRTEKLEAYSKAGVGEIWLVDWHKRQVDIYVSDDDLNGSTKAYHYLTVTDENKDELKLVNFPITKISFDELFDLSILDD